MLSTRSGASSNTSSSSQKGYRCDYGRSQSVTEGQVADTSTRSLSGHIQSQTEALQQFIAAQRVLDPCRSVEKLNELLPDCESISGLYQHLQVTQWMKFIDGKEKHDSFNRRMEEKQPSTTQASAKKIPRSQKQKFQCKEKPQAQNKGKVKEPATKTLSKGYRIPTIQKYAM
ncbi:hypothetical protein O181_100453 [Austropuccinia psidii MF-1]|uniref:Uncharacterized protein n=1 Tax=Austropuccinia psidii MF-1 TaxID=1389203 RepID=A0A9Q3JCR6_9BASI|nr:hypothetical protein [Austropuccinia psidii MF-1]